MFHCLGVLVEFNSFNSLLKLGYLTKQTSSNKLSSHCDEQCIQWGDHEFDSLLLYVKKEISPPFVNIYIYIYNIRWPSYSKGLLSVVLVRNENFDI